MGGRLASGAAIVIAMAIALTACGGSSSSSESTTSGQPSTEASAPADSAQAGVRASIVGFGKEGTAEAREEAAAAVEAFFAARADQDWATACPYLSAEMRGRVKQIGGPGDAGCGKGIEALTAEATLSDGESTVAEAEGLRREGDQAFLIYTSGGGVENAMLITLEGGAWKLAGLNPTPLS